MVRETRRKRQKEGITLGFVSWLMRLYFIHYKSGQKPRTAAIEFWDVNLIMVGDMGKFSDFEM